MSEPVAVRVRACACPDSPHPDGDMVYLAPTLSLAGGIAAELDISALRGANGIDSNSLIAAWTITFVRHGAIGWNFPEPFDVNVLLADYGLSRLVAEKANDLYFDTALSPLLARLAGPSRNGRTADSTSPPRESIKRRRKPSSPATTAATVLSPP